jgi:hypothetical protein
MKTVIQALISKVHWPLPYDFVETTCIERGIDGNKTFSAEIAATNDYKGALADCLYSLVQAVNFSEAGKSVGNLTDEQRRLILKSANRLYDEIGEPLKDDGEPVVIFGG